MCEVLFFLSKSTSAALYVTLLKYPFIYNLIIPKLRYCQETSLAFSVNCCFHIFFALIQNKATIGSLGLKRGVLKGRRPSGKRRRPLPNLWHEWNKWMKENENGRGVISGRQCKTSANYYEWETAAELMKKKELTFFIHHPRIINHGQAFWWGWGKPQDTWLTSHCKGGQWHTKRGRRRRNKRRFIGGQSRVLVTFLLRKEHKWN